MSQQQRQVGAVPSRGDQGRVAQLVQRPPGARLERSPARRYDSHAPLVGSRSRSATVRVGRRSPRLDGLPGDATDTSLTCIGHEVQAVTERSARRHAADNWRRRA